MERFTKDANPQVLSNIVHGYAKLGVFDERVFGAVGDEAAKVAKDGQMHEITNIIWAFAVAGMVRANEGRILELWEEAWRRVEGEGSEVELIQLENARLLAKECEGVELEIGGEEGMRERVERAIERQWEEGGEKGGGRGGMFEENVVKDLEAFGFGGFEREVRTGGGERNDDDGGADDGGGERI